MVRSSLCHAPGDAGVRLNGFSSRLPDKLPDNRGQLSRLFQLWRLTAFVDHIQLRAPDRVAVSLAVGEWHEADLLTPNHQYRRLHAPQPMNQLGIMHLLLPRKPL